MFSRTHTDNQFFEIFLDTQYSKFVLQYWPDMVLNHNHRCQFWHERRRSSLALFKQLTGNDESGLLFSPIFSFLLSFLHRQCFSWNGCCNEKILCRESWRGCPKTKGTLYKTNSAILGHPGKQAVQRCRRWASNLINAMPVFPKTFFMASVIIAIFNG